MKKGKLDEKVVEMYEKELLPCSEIARKYGVTRQCVWHYLKGKGVDTSKHKRVVKCANCGKEIERTKKRVRFTRYPTCDRKCYYELIRNDGFQQSRQGQRIGREVIEKLTFINSDWVVHHVDGDDYNNEVKNLWAFRTSSDHHKYHRGVPTEAYVAEKQEWMVVEKKLEGKRLENGTPYHTI